VLLKLKSTGRELKCSKLVWLSFTREKQELFEIIEENEKQIMPIKSLRGEIK